MGWTEPKTWVGDEYVDETDLNTHVRDNFNAVMRSDSGFITVTGVTSVTTDEAGQQTISFGYTFASPPVVVFSTGIPTDNVTGIPAIDSVDETGWTLGWINHADYGPFDVHWIAIGEPT